MSDTDHRVLAALYRTLPPSGGHPDEDTWVRFATSALADDARARLIDHVLSCAECVATYRALEIVRTQAAGPTDERLWPPAMPFKTPLPSPPAHDRWWTASRTWLAAAATLSIAVAAAVVQMRVPHDASSPPAASLAPPASPAGPAPAVPEATGAPSQPIVADWARDIQAPAVQLPARYALVVRGPDAHQAFLQAFGPAIQAYRDGRYPEAAERLQAVARDFADVPEAAFYLGLSRLLAGDASGAIAPLEQAHMAESLGPDARWFGAIACERAGQTAAARVRLQDLCARPGDYQARACAALGVTP